MRTRWTYLSLSRNKTAIAIIFDITLDYGFGKRVFSKGFLKYRYDTWTPAQLARIATGHWPIFEPGTSWSYPNTNYVRVSVHR